MFMHPGAGGGNFATRPVFVMTVLAVRAFQAPAAAVVGGGVCGVPDHRHRRIMTATRAPCMLCQAHTSYSLCSSCTSDQQQNNIPFKEQHSLHYLMRYSCAKSAASVKGGAACLELPMPLTIVVRARPVESASLASLASFHRLFGTGGAWAACRRCCS